MAKTQTKEERDRLFSEAPVVKALSTVAIPTIISQLIILIYNMADTFFVGRVGNPYMIAAVSVSFTLFLFNIPMSGLFGVGGGSYIARLIGMHDYDRVKRVSAFCFYGSLAVAVVYSLAIALFIEPILYALGASEDTILYSKQYTWVVVVIGSVPSVLSSMLSHLLRNVGYSKQAGFGLSLGGILNIIFDPLFMFVLMPDGNQVLGAAIATTLSNVIATVYYLVIFNRIKSETGLSMSPKDIIITKYEAAQIFKIGIPSAMTTLLMDFSNMFLNKSMAKHNDIALAALGIGLKIDRLSNAICLGIALGILPLVAYNYSVKNFKRLKQFINYGRIAGLLVAVVSIVLYELFAKELVGVFISSKKDPEIVAKTIEYGIIFVSIRCLAAPFSMLNFVSTSSFQALGDGKMSLVQVFFRQVLLYLPLLYILDRCFGEVGLAAAYPSAEFLSGAISTVLLQLKLKKVKYGFEHPELKIRERANR